MAEQLGDAVLALRTDDSQFTRGVDQAEGKARRLEGTLDRTSTSSGKLGQALTATGRSAGAMGTQFDQAGRRVVQSAGAQRAGMQQLGMQIGDMATMYSLGARPMQIFASQSGQVMQSIQLLMGGTSRFATFISGPWGIAIMTATIVLTPLIGKLFETDQAMEAVEEGADAMARAQSALAPVFDLVSGKLKTQNELLIINARLMAINLRAEAAAKRAGARETLVQAQRPGAGSITDPRTWLGLATPTGIGNARAARQLLLDIGAGRISRADAIAQAETMDFSEMRVTRNEFMGALRDATVANLNDRAAALIDQSLDDGSLAAGLREPGRPARGGREREGPTQEEIERRYNAELIGVTQQILSARQQLASTAEERAELEWKSVEWARRQALDDVEANEDYSAAQKAELSAAITRRADAEIEVIMHRKGMQQEQERQNLADDRFRAEADALHLQYELADSQAERKRIAFEIFDAEQAYLRSKLEAVLLSETANAHEKQRAQLALDALQASAAAHRESVSRGNETDVERFLRQLNRTPAQIGEAIDRVKMDGLDALNEGIVDAIMGARTLGEVFHDVAGQIVADLLRIAIQRAIIAPLANALFPGAGAAAGAGAGGLGSIFAGLFAHGGLIPAGQFGIVGERGPEPVIGTSRGAMVLPNRRLRDAERNGGTTVNQTINVPARADPRHTIGTVARGTQMGLSRAARKGLAAPAGGPS